MGFEIAAIIAAVVGAAVQVRQQNIAEDAADVATAMEKDKARASERQAIREKRIKLAQVEQGSFNAGVSESAGAVGAGSSITSQFNASAGLAARQQMGFDSLNSLQEQSNRLATFNTAAQSVFKIASVSGGMGGTGSSGGFDPNSMNSANNVDPFSITA